MVTGGLEVADVFRDGATGFLSEYGPMLSREQRGVLRAVMNCRTPALGGHRQKCDACGHERIQYNSCRNRHCPKCQARARAEWTEARCTELLPIPYFHVVFTLPNELRPLALQNKRIVYGILFQAAAETLKAVAANPKHLGAEIGILAVLHTWGQNLMHHPHTHCVVTGGGISPDRSHWIPCQRSRRRKKLFFLPVEILSEVFRGKFIELLKRAFSSGQLEFHGQLAFLAQPTAFEHCLNVSVREDWVVYAKRPFGGPERVLKYLARYTHRVAISNQRLVDLQGGRVRFRYKDYADQQRTKVMSLSTSEFIRRFLMHTLPSGFVRIRYYGLLANRDRQERLDRCRSLLGVEPHTVPPTEEVSESSEALDSPATHQTCPVCQRGKLVIIDVIPAAQPPRRPYFLTHRSASSPHLHNPPRPPPTR
jgi:hypothetical protein